MATARAGKMTKAAARAWRARWRTVNERHLQAVREMTLDDKLVAMDQLMAYALSFPEDPRREREVRRVRRRWAKLREVLGGK